ncbi:MAG TPA: cyclic pyranopterin monophosphate synthase MoaC [Candidatus Azoamicus sp. OHIO2]
MNKFIYNKTSYNMINISNKTVSYRRACVSGSINVGKTIFNLIKNKKIEKGDPLVLAEIAGITAAKNTSMLILLCHQINIENVFINITMDETTYTINVYCIVFANSKTGVEMEAMCGVYAALLTIYDLTKKFNPFILINNVKLLFKDGGENGLILGSINNIPYHLQTFFLDTKLMFNNITIVIITLSDRGSKGYYEDLSGQVIADFFNVRHATLLYKIIIPDDQDILKNILIKVTTKHTPHIILTTGGTGLSKNDITTNIVSNVCDKHIPGISEFLRLSGSYQSITSWLSSSFAGIYKKSLIICLPGNPSAVFESLNLLEELLFHSIEIVTKS